MSKRTRKNRSSSEKIALLKRHHMDKVPVSTICEEHQLQPSVFYSWQRQLFENSASLDATSRRAPSREKELEEKVRQLEAKLARKDAVIAEVSEELVKTKKELGEL
jgi:transposase-like protein